MIKNIIDKWDTNKDNLKEHFNSLTKEQLNSISEYTTLVKDIIDNVLNVGDTDKFSDEMDVINFGDYQGTLIVTFHKDSYPYQPTAAETFYTVIEYGSCSGCDTLLGITDYGESKETMIKELMDLCLNIVQEIKCFDPEQMTF